MIPGAVNFDPNATESDGSCIFLTKIGNTCYAFQEFDPTSLEDFSFTLSYALEGDNWVFFHDYLPDFYFHTRQKLHNIVKRPGFDQNSYIHTHNTGPMGQYHDGTKKSFFIDLVFKSGEEMTLNSVSWVTEVVNRVNKLNEEFTTLSHISIWNAWQHTGRISLAQVFDSLEVKNVRRTQSQWHFNDFRDLVVTRGSQILMDIFNNFAVQPTAIDSNLPWYEKKLLEDKYFVVRLEFDNSQDKVVFLHDANADVTKSTR